MLMRAVFKLARAVKCKLTSLLTAASASEIKNEADRVCVKSRVSTWPLD